MKRYLLLASVAGCLLNAGNALAISDPITVNSTDDLSAVVNISAKLAKAMVWRYNDVNFGNIVLSGTAANGDTIATFEAGELEFVDGKTITHGSEDAGWIDISSGGAAAMAAGISFDPTTVDLTDVNSNVVAQMTDIAPNDYDAGSYYINGSLKLINKEKVSSTGTIITGTTTVTLEF